MSHLPKRTLYDVLAQRQRVLRGREETWLERNRHILETCAYWSSGLAFAALIGGGMACGAMLLGVSPWLAAAFGAFYGAWFLAGCR